MITDNTIQVQVIAQAVKMMDCEIIIFRRQCGGWNSNL